MYMGEIASLLHCERLLCCIVFPNIYELSFCHRSDSKRTRACLVRRGVASRRGRRAWAASGRGPTSWNALFYLSTPSMPLAKERREGTYAGMSGASGCGISSG
jgi:hypothetical protein